METKRIRNGGSDAAPLLLDAAAVAKRLGVSKATVWRLRDSGRLPQPIKVGSLTRWRTADVEAWVATLATPSVGKQVS
jgi:prophage regulatory protein